MAYTKSSAVQNFLQAKAYKQQQSDIARQNQINQLMGTAMLDPNQNLEALAILDPNRAMQIKQIRAGEAEQARLRQQQEAQLQREQHERLRTDVSKFDTFEQAASYAAQQAPDAPPLTPEAFSQIKTVYGEKAKPIELGKGERLIDPKTFKTLVEPSETVDKTETMKYATALRKELSGLSKSFSTQDDAYGRVLASAQDPSGAGDLAMIFNYMKVLDPGSTVREGEFATAAGARGALDNAEKEGGYVPAIVSQAVNRLLEGTRLTDDQRVDFVDRSKKLYSDAATKQLKREKRFSKLAKKAEVDVEDVVDSLVNYRDEAFGAIGQAAAQPQVEGAPQVGEERDGYKFKGGDPASPESWEAI